MSDDQTQKPVEVLGIDLANLGTLCLRRRATQSISIPVINTTIFVESVTSNIVKVVITSPKGIEIKRTELLNQGVKEPS